MGDDALSEKKGALLAFILALPVLITLGAALAYRQMWQPQQEEVTVAPTVQEAATPAPPSPYPTPSEAEPEPTDTLTPTPPVGVVALPLVKGQWPTATPTTKPTKTKTRRPAATATPVLPWPDALEKPSRSKLGIHVQWNNSPEIMEFVRRMKPAVVKGIGDLGFMNELKKESPSTVTVARLAGSLQMEGDPAQAARRYVAEHLEDYQHNPAVDYWEGVNEPDVGDTMAWFAAFEAERVRVMAEHGLRTAVGGFSAGVPEWEEFGAFLPAIRAAKRYGGIFAVHEYDAPTLDRSAGAGLPGHPNYADRGALALRYRWWYEDFLKPQNLVVPLVISEAGVDGLVRDRPGPEGKGWRNFTGYWEEQGLGGDDAQVYLRQLAWYDAELQKDNYVIGCALFTAGAMNEDWRSYDITDILRHIATYIIVPNA